MKLDKNNSIIINDYFETSKTNIFAIGDVVDKKQLTPVAISEAMTFVDNLKKNKKRNLIIIISQLQFSQILIMLLLVFQSMRQEKNFPVLKYLNRLLHH